MVNDGVINFSIVNRNLDVMIDKSDIKTSLNTIYHPQHPTDKDRGGKAVKHHETAKISQKS